MKTKKKATKRWWESTPRTKGNPVRDLKAACAREVEKIGKDNPILVPEAVYNVAVDIAKQNEMDLTIKAVWRTDKRKKLCSWLSQKSI